MLQLDDYSAPCTVSSPNQTKENKFFSIVLEQFDLNFVEYEEYLQVGEIKLPAGWIIDVSVLVSQFDDLLVKIIPHLKHENIPFQIVSSRENASSIVSGHSGLLQVGKMISIFPTSDSQASTIASSLIALTKLFSGPEILTDFRLGGVVYTRFGTFVSKFVEASGERRQVFLNDAERDLANSYLNIPFILPTNVKWPFAFANPQKTIDPHFLKNKYRRIKLLKEDAKGSVIKAIWISKFTIKWCVIKEGKKFQSADSQGRDMRDRIRWQFQLHNELTNIIPVPKAYELFDESENSYLAIEYKSGKVLDDLAVELAESRLWPAISIKNRSTILHFALEILDIIEKMHLLGYVHRDITPANFLVVRQSIWVIDLELTYSKKISWPKPPFELGTYGFMSPEQQDARIPDYSQDIYAIGGLLISLLTGLFPRMFSLDSPAILIDQLDFFIPRRGLVRTIGQCFSKDPSHRPSMATVRAELVQFKSQQTIDSARSDDSISIAADAKTQIDKVINSSLKALATDAIMKLNGIWASKAAEDNKFSYSQTQTYKVTEGYSTGLSGIAVLLSRAFRMGYFVEHSLPEYSKCIGLIRNRFVSGTPNSSGGLYEGAAGFIVSLVEGFQSGLLTNKSMVTSDLETLLNNRNISGNGVAKGWAGLGLAQSQIPTTLIRQSDIASALNNTLQNLLDTQQKDGSWLAVTDKRRHIVKPTGFAHGTSGITCFLLSYLHKSNNEIAFESAKKAMKWLVTQAKRKKHRLFWRSHTKSNKADLSMQNGTIGIALTFLKAYAILKDQIYRQFAEEILYSVPFPVVSRDLTLSSGIVGLGELYIEASQVLNSSEWEKDAAWVAGFLCHHFVTQKDGSTFWPVENVPYSSAELTTGMSGIIHFLIRYNNPGKLTHPLLMF